MSRKKVHHEEHADESWLLPYSDLLTLLLALFIVMFAMGQVDKEKFEKVRAQFNIIFSGGSGILEKDGTSILPLNISEVSNTADKSKLEDDKMIEILNNLGKEIKNDGYSDKVIIALDKDGLKITIQDILLFNSGDAEVLNGVYPLLHQISKMLNSLDNSIKIVGHTDNVPIHTEKFRSNWDLSAIRAINVMNFLVEQGGLKPDRFSVQGFGQYSPKFDNSTAEGRAKNRRVEIFLVRKYTITNESSE